jgi:hypothetical protein
MLLAPSLASIISHYAPVAESLAVLLSLMAELELVGWVATSFLPSGTRSTLSLASFFLPGLFVSTSFAETWSLFGGLVPWANLSLILIVAALAVMRWRVCRSTLRDAVGNTRRLNLVLLVPCALCAALNALTNGFCNDSLLYHLAAVRWVAEFGSVPGLANLHGRLGFNSALHPLAALFGTPFGAAVGDEFVNPAIVLSVGLVLLQGFQLTLKEFFTPRSVYAALLLPLWLGLLFSWCLSSPQPDVASVAIAILVTWHLREVIFERKVTAEGEQGTLLWCLMASSLVVTLKLSYAVFGFAAGVLAMLIILIRQRRLPAIFWPAIFVFVVSIPWVCRGYITSGYPFYPSELGAIRFDWMVPHEAALNDKNWVLSWARDPTRDWHSVLANIDWLRPWLATTLGDDLVRKSLLLGAAGLVLCVISGPWRWRKESFYRCCCLITPILLSLVFWFLTAPDPRFAGATIWTAGADIFYVAFACLDSVRLSVRVLFTVLIAGFIALELKAGSMRLLKEHEQFPNFVGDPPEMVPRVTFSGLTIWVPSKGNLPGPWKIPATPPDYYKPSLELRGKTLQDGFRINAAAR